VETACHFGEDTNSKSPNRLDRKRNEGRTQRTSGTYYSRTNKCGKRREGIVGGRDSEETRAKEENPASKRKCNRCKAKHLLQRESASAHHHKCTVLKKVLERKGREVVLGKGGVIQLPREKPVDGGKEKKGKLQSTVNTRRNFKEFREGADDPLGKKGPGGS